MPPKPKKPKLTPEEKQALLAEKKVLKKLAIEEGKRQVKRDNLTRELEYGRRNRRKIEKIWKQTLIDLKVPILRTEYQLQINSFDKLVDIKDFTISLLLDELDVADEQYRFNTQAHCERINDIIDIFHKSLSDLKCSYDHEYNNLLQSNDIENEYATTRQKSEEEFVNVMSYGLDAQERNMDKTIWSEYLSKLKEEVNKNTNELYKMRATKENFFEEFWNNYKSSLKNYTICIADRRKEYNIMQRQDAWMRNKIKEQYIQIYDSYEAIRKLKERQSANQESLSLEIRDMDDELQHFLSHFEDMKTANSKNMEFDNEQLTLLVIDSNKSIKFLEQLHDKAERILRFYNMCRPYETQREKVLAHPKTLPNLKQEGPFPFVPIYKDLEPFWQKYAQVGCTMHILKEELLAEGAKNKEFRKNLARLCSYSLMGCQVSKLPDIADIQQNIYTLTA